MTDVIRTSKDLSPEELVKYLDHLARCHRGVLRTVSNDPQRFALVTAADERAIQQAANMLRGSPETRASAAMREAGKHVFCGANPNWIGHAGDCDAAPCTCGLSDWLNANMDLLGIHLRPTLKALEPRDWVIVCGDSFYGINGAFVMLESNARGFQSCADAQDFAKGMRCPWSVRERSATAQGKLP